MRLFTYAKVVVLAVLATSAPLLADTFLLRDGRRLEGTAEEDGDTLIITTYSGEVVRVARKEVMGSTSEPARNAFYVKLKALTPNDAGACVLLGRWAAEQNLKAEAKRAFEQALTIDPANAEALNELGRPGTTVAAPGGNGDLVIAPAANRPERVERDEVRALVKRLLNLKEGDAAETQALLALARERPELFTQLLKTPPRTNEAAMRLRAVQFMGQAGDRRALDALLGACFEEPDAGVRQAAARSLAQLDEPIALRKLTDVALAPQFPWATRQRACAALRAYGDPEAVDRILSALSFELAGGNALDAKNPLVRSPGGLGSENALETQEGNLPVGPVDERVSYPALSALKELTGVSFDAGEKDFATWQQWWRKNRATFRFRP